MSYNLFASADALVNTIWTYPTRSEEFALSISHVISYIIDLVPLGFLYIGYRGLRTWREQLEGSNKYRLAQKALLTTYEVEHAMNLLRSPTMFLSDKAIDPSLAFEEKRETYVQRLAMLDRKWAELRLIQLESKVFWGDAADSCFRELEKQRAKLIRGIYEHLYLTDPSAPPGLIDRNPKRVARNEEVIYSTGEDFSADLTEAVKKVEMFFYLQLHPQSHLRRLFTNVKNSEGAVKSTDEPT